MRPLTDTETQRVLNAAKSRPAHQRLVLRLLLEYELTAHEICRLRSGDVRGSVITVRDKRGGSRTVRLHDEAAAELAEMTTGGPGAPLVRGRRGPITPDALRRLLIDAAADADLPRSISIHRARRHVDTTA